jgi:hypothetical protein
MNFPRVQYIVFVLMLPVWQASAAVLYVDVNSPGPVPPYNSLATAASDIQTAINAATNGDLVLVNDGYYATGTTATKQFLTGLSSTYYDTNRVAITKSVTVQSINGPTAAYIDGGGQFRCAFVTNGAILSGFTLQNGLAGWTQTTVLLGHSTTKTNLGYGAGVAGINPGLNQGLVTNCIISDNFAYGYGGGAAEVSLVNCTLQYNSALSGGGAFACSLTNCVINDNNAQTTGKTSSGPQPPTTTESAVGGGLYRGWAYNCLVENNSAFDGGGAFGALSLINCTIVNNSSSYAGGVDNIVLEAGITFNAFYNCIIYDNSASGTNSNFGTGSLAFNSCCLTPLPANGTGNFTNDPAFEDYWGGDFHLQATSVCINSGDNSAVIVTNDLDGNPRIIAATVDTGCYEFTNPASMLGYLWAQQYGFPVDGSADFLDPDGDGMNNWQEFVAGTNPTNAASVLTMYSAVPQPSFNLTFIQWQGVSTRTYYLQRSTNLSAGFSTIQSNIVGYNGTNLIYDTIAPNGGSYFYRIGVQW